MSEIYCNDSWELNYGHQFTFCWINKSLAHIFSWKRITQIEFHFYTSNGVWRKNSEQNYKGANIVIFHLVLLATHKPTLTIKRKRRALLTYQLLLSYWTWSRYFIMQFNFASVSAKCIWPSLHPALMLCGKYHGIGCAKNTQELILHPQQITFQHCLDGSHYTLTWQNYTLKNKKRHSSLGGFCFSVIC